MNKFSSILEALNELKKGNMLILLDNPKRENQADLIFPAVTVTTEKINFMLQKCRGMICTPITHTTSDQLNLQPMIPSSKNTEKTKVNFTITVDAKKVTSFGISASDRALTIKTIANPKSKPSDLVRPGHVFPLLAAKGGLLKRDGHTEATVELMKLSGFSPTGVLTEILNDRGEVANLSELQKFSKKYNIKIITIPDLIDYVQKTK